MATLRVGVAALVLGCGAAEPPRGAIVILLDAARPDRFSAYGYPRRTTPNMDTLAERGVVFRDCFTQGTYTRSALPSLLYSRYHIRPLFPNSNQVPFSSPDDLFRKPDEESVSLPRALAKAGFRTAMISAHLWLKPNTIFASEFDEAYDLSAIVPYDRSKYRQPPAEKAVDFAIDWLAQNGDRSFFLYLHLMDTHFPHGFEEDAKRFLSPELHRQVPLERFEPGGRPQNIQAGLSRSERMYLDAIYDGSLRYADRHIGRLLDFLGDRLEHTLIAVTADHGEFLVEQPGRFGHGGRWYDLVAKVPLILFYPPAIEPRVSDVPTELVDLMPTVLRLLDVPLPPGKRVDGTDLIAVVGGETPPREYAFMKRSVRGPRYKCLFSVPDEVLLADAAPAPDELSGELYDLDADPEETDDLWSSRPAAVADCLSRYRSKMTASYHRYLAAREDRLPRSPFAIDASHFATDEEVASASGSAEVTRHLESGEGWIRWDDSDRSYLLAHGSSGPMRIEFPVPSGRYRLSASMLGTGTAMIDGQELRVTARPLGPGQPLPRPLDHAPYGTVDVRGGRFVLTLAPDTSDSPFVIRYLGFRPVDSAGTTASGDDPERERELLERLRALGYVD
jgi:arylsulfatase A-like enzyme